MSFASTCGRFLSSTEDSYNDAAPSLWTSDLAN